MVVVVTALCSMVSVVKSLFLLKSARDFAMKEIREPRGKSESFFVCVVFVNFFFFLFFFCCANLFVLSAPKTLKLKNF